MSYKTKEDVMQRVQEHHAVAVEKYGDRVVGTFLQGSWNYGWELCDEESDVDTKCLLLPTFEDFCLGKKMVSTTHVLPNNEHIDFKDLRLYMNCFKKQNVNFVEILFTEFFVLNPLYEEQIQRLFDAREDIGRYDVKAALNCICGMAYEKEKALCHPYPATMDKIEKFQYDPKQLSHILRLSEFMAKYLKDVSYEQCLKTNQGKFLLNVKRRDVYNLEAAKDLASSLTKDLKNIKDGYLAEHEVEKNTEVDALFDDVCVECMKINFLNFVKNNC